MGWTATKLDSYITLHQKVTIMQENYPKNRAVVFCWHTKQILITEVHQSCRYKTKTYLSLFNDI